MTNCPDWAKLAILLSASQTAGVISIHHYSQLVINLDSPFLAHPPDSGLLSLSTLVMALQTIFKRFLASHMAWLFLSSSNLTLGHSLASFLYLAASLPFSHLTNSSELPSLHTCSLPGAQLVPHSTDWPFLSCRVPLKCHPLSEVFSAHYFLKMFPAFLFGFLALLSSISSAALFFCILPQLECQLLEDKDPA